MSEGSRRVGGGSAAPDLPGPSLTLGMTVTDMLQRHEKLVLKPLIGGSSRGLFFVKHGDPIPDISVPYIVEQFIAGRELTVGVLDGVALPVIEIEVDPGFEFDYAGKYLGKGTHEICPADIPDAMRDEAQRVAVAAHEGLGCAGCSRTDVIAAADGTVYFIELNTLPGLTTSSLVPQQLRAAGISMREFLEREITSAARRRSRAPRHSR
jgi:D-alanine-D-alanine ligase